MALADDDGLTSFGSTSCGCLMCCSGARSLLTEERATLGTALGSVAVTSAAIAALLPDGEPKWGSSAIGTGAVVTYSFMTAAPSYADADDRFGFAEFNATQRAAAREVLADWAAVANLTFTEVSDSGGGGQIRFGTNNQLGISGGYAYYPSSSSTGGDIYISNEYATNLSPTVGGYGYSTLVHEIGHAIGLKHPGDYNAGGGGTEGPYLPASEDSTQYSVMSYNDHPSLGSRYYASGPELYDIAAIQYLYGVNSTTRTGDNAYAFTTTTSAVQRSIWDAGGTDTINASTQVRNSVISLVAGTFSSIGPNGSGGTATNNISIAAGVVIENAVGGHGNDTITGNAVSNELTGGGGNDTIDGGAGTDVAVFSGRKIDYLWNTGASSISVRGTDGTDTLSNIEILRFDDGSVNLSIGTLVYRFYNSSNGTHFYTSSETERDAVLSSLPTFGYEGPSFGAGSTGDSVWRFYNTATGTHFYTISATERDYVRANLLTYQFEGEAYKASISAEEGLSPLYRFYNTQTGAHFYTASEAEAAAVTAGLPQFQPEGTAYYIGLL